jgi:4-hydroxy-3-methylbut-2-enyl diphosphate reductase
MHSPETARISHLDRILTSKRRFIDLNLLIHYNTGSPGIMTRVFVDRNAGFCGGVRRAVRETEKLLSSNGRIVSYGQLVHNREVTDCLAAQGLESVEELRDVRTGDEVVVRAHGIPPGEEKLLRERGARVRDLTCPRVKEVHRRIREKLGEGYRIVIVGDPGHPEVRAHLGYAGAGARVMRSAEDARRLPSDRKIALFAQTTITPQAFHEAIASLKDRDVEVVVVDTVCPYVSKRQRWIEKYSRVADASLILGGKNSSNTRKLHAIAAANGPAFHLSTAAELQTAEILSYPLVALTAGASTSDRTIDEVVSRLREAGAEIERR